MFLIMIVVYDFMILSGGDGYVRSEHGWVRGDHLSAWRRRPPPWQPPPAAQRTHVPHRLRVGKYVKAE
jgi:hypothetical protein